MLPLPLRHASRSLRRTPAFTVTAILTLVIGIGAMVAIFALIHGVLLRPLPYGDSERLVTVSHRLPPLSIEAAGQTSGLHFTYQRLARTIEDLAIVQEGSANVARPGSAIEPQRLRAAYATASLFPALRVSPIMGRGFTEAEDLPNGPNVVVISEALWRNQFGAAPDIVGRQVEINGVTREIVGVMPERFRYPDDGIHLWLPLQLDPNVETGGFSYSGVARLAPGVTVEQAERELATLLPRYPELFPEFAPGVPTQALLDQAKPIPVITPLREDMTGGIARTLWVVGAAAALVLLVACANVANLILVRADGRQRELAVREALGAGRGRVLALFLNESVILAGAATLLGFVVAWIAVRLLVVTGPADIPRLAELNIDGVTVAFAVGVALFVALVCSAIPALRIGRVPLVSGLREGGRGGTAGRAQHRLRGAMVALQMALALVVLAGSGLLIRTFQQLSSVRPGFDPENVATFWLSLPRARYPDAASYTRFYAQLTERVAALPGVQSVGLTSRLPLAPHGINQSPFYSEDDTEAATRIPPLQLYTTVDAGYFQTMGIPLLAGRGFERYGVQRDGEAIISQRTAEQFWNDPTGRTVIGKRFRMLPTGPWYTIVGVVGGVRDTSLAAPPPQAVYFPEVAGPDTNFAQTRRTMALVVKTTGDPMAITGAVHATLRELDPTLPTFEVRSMEAVMRASVARLSFTIMLLGAAAVVTLVLGAVGLYGVMAYVVTLRTRELGVRIALGAAPSAVAAMMTRQGLLLAGVGLGTGLVLFAIVARFLQAFLYGITPADPVTLIGATLALLATAAMASWVPARRAARVDPAESLRAD
ncbi:MAG TPA: ABC transporter permease [Gemmatimonadaceae bacterium]